MEPVLDGLGNQTRLLTEAVLGSRVSLVSRVDQVLPAGRAGGPICDGGRSGYRSAGGVGHISGSQRPHSSADSQPRLAPVIPARAPPGPRRKLYGDGPGPPERRKIGGLTLPLTTTRPLDLQPDREFRRRCREALRGWPEAGGSQRLWPASASGSAGLTSVWPKSFPLNNRASPVVFARA